MHYQIIPESDDCYETKMIQGKVIENDSGEERAKLNRIAREGFF